MRVRDTASAATNDPAKTAHDTTKPILSDLHVTARTPSFQIPPRYIQGMDVREWLADFEDFVQATRTPDKFWVLWSYLERNTKELLEFAITGQTSDERYESAKRELICMSGTREKTQSEYRNEFRDRKQRPGEPVKRFFNELCRIGRKAFRPESIDAELRASFINGLRDRALAIAFRGSEFEYVQTLVLVEKAADKERAEIIQDSLSNNARHESSIPKQAARFDVQRTTPQDYSATREGPLMRQLQPQPESQRAAADQ